MKVLIRILPLLIGFLSISNAENWPDGFLVYEKSVSPDKRFGILIPSQEKVESDEKPGETNYLADLKTHRVLGKIDGARYWERGNRVWLKVRWAPDSSVCVPIYEARFGFHSVSALILDSEQTSFRQIDLGEKIQNDLDRVIPKQSDDSSRKCEALLAAGISETEILFRALGETNPKRFEDRESYYASFSGVFDLKTRKWGDVTAHSLDHSEFLAADSALLNLDEASVALSLESQAGDLDETLNNVYRRVRSSLTADRFAQVRSEQIAWLKQRDSIKDLPERNEFVEARIAVLNGLIKPAGTPGPGH